MTIEKLDKGIWVEGEPSEDGQKYRRILDGHVFEEGIFYNPDVEVEARRWRDLQLTLTDKIVPITDHPKHVDVLGYRDDLRDWPETDDFPNIKPINPLE